MLSLAGTYWLADGLWLLWGWRKYEKRILDYLQLSLQGTGIAALGTLSIFEPKFETVIFGEMCLIGGLLIAIKNKGV